MNLLSRIKRWVGSEGDEESPYVCVYCSADLDRNYQECPKCHKPYVTVKEEADGENDR